MHAVRIFGQRPALGGPARDRAKVESVLGVDAARVVCDSGHDRAALDQLGRGHAADLAEALHDAALPGELPPQPLAGALDDHDDPRSRRFVSEDRTADRDRLAGHDLGRRVPDLHRVGVHHPGHRLLVRGHVRRRDVLLRPDRRAQLLRVAPGQPLELTHGELAGIAANAALGASVGQP